MCLQNPSAPPLQEQKAEIGVCEGSLRLVKVHNGLEEILENVRLNLEKW